MANSLSNIHVRNDSALMNDILNDISVLSNALQERNIW